MVLKESINRFLLLDNLVSVKLVMGPIRILSLSEFLLILILNRKTSSQIVNRPTVIVYSE